MTTTGNSILGEGARAVASALAPDAHGVYNETLTSINLTYNHIGDEGMIALAAALAPT